MVSDLYDLLERMNNGPPLTDVELIKTKSLVESKDYGGHCRECSHRTRNALYDTGLCKDHIYERYPDLEE